MGVLRRSTEHQYGAPSSSPIKHNHGCHLPISDDGTHSAITSRPPQLPPSPASCPRRPSASSPTQASSIRPPADGPEPSRATGGAPRSCPRASHHKPPPTRPISIHDPSSPSAINEHQMPKIQQLHARIRPTPSPLPPSPTSVRPSAAVASGQAARRRRDSDRSSPIAVTAADLHHRSMADSSARSSHGQPSNPSPSSAPPSADLHHRSGGHAPSTAVQPQSSWNPQ
ncbi:hypothetical protein ACLOJK_034818 [Asimina triloba]